MYMFLCSRVIKYILTGRGESKSFNMNHSRRAGFSDSEFPQKFVEKSCKLGMLSDVLEFLETGPLRSMSLL